MVKKHQKSLQKYQSKSTIFFFFKSSKASKRTVKTLLKKPLKKPVKCKKKKKKVKSIKQQLSS